MTYTNELEVKLDFSDVDPNLLEEVNIEENEDVIDLEDNGDLFYCGICYN